MSSSSGSTGFGKAGAKVKEWTVDLITKYISDANKKSGGGVQKFWSVERPGTFLALSGGKKYAMKDASRASAQPGSGAAFVYNPDLRVAGTVQHIYNVLQYALSKAGRPLAVQVGALNQMSGGAFGQPSATVALDVSSIYNNSIDPRNPAHAALIASITPARGSGTAARKGPTMHVSEWSAIVSHITKAAPAKKEGGKAKGKGGGGGSKDPQANRARRVSDFNAAMSEVLSGMTPAKVINVTKFNPATNIGARNQPAPQPSATGASRSQARRLVINVPGRGMVQLPIIFQPNADEAFRAYVTNVVSHSQQYRELAQPMLSALQDAQRGTGMIQGAGQFVAAAPVAFPQQFAPSTSPRSTALGQASPAPLFSQQMAPLATQQSPIRGFQTGGIPPMPTTMATSGFGSMAALPQYGR
ncbi:MAG: hypothetical protein Solivirus6_2 [Solivirus sp.]|uniref:Uncharacterized protein n=1 Tax=Solivirus sp. TaxID=2487772 RepID=A0A3G5AJJ5_9VIRU|nr:MAG: hypothetical protein Solivirus6_2 [Solivirus sp.]